MPPAPLDPPPVWQLVAASVNATAIVRVNQRTLNASLAGRDVNRLVRDAEAKLRRKPFLLRGEVERAEERAFDFERARDFRIAFDSFRPDLVRAGRKIEPEPVVVMAALAAEIAVQRKVAVNQTLMSSGAPAKYI